MPCLLLQMPPVRRALAVALATLSFAAAAAVDANQATQADLEALAGIGPALSGKILAARQLGPFKGWDDLMQRVAGIGAGNAARLSQAGLTVGGGAFAGEAPKRAARAAGRASMDR